MTPTPTLQPPLTIIPPGNSGISKPENGLEIFYYPLIGILLVGILYEGWKAVKVEK